MRLLRRVLGLGDAGLEPATPEMPSSIGPGIHFKGDIHGEGTT